MASDDIKKIINEADEDLLRMSVEQWAVQHEDFRAYITLVLNPPASEIDFDYELARVINNNTELIDSRYFERLVVDWSEIVYRLIEPWAKVADSFSTERLQKLVEAIITEVGMKVQEDDFRGDDWYSDDYSVQIEEIMDWLGHLSGLLLIREDLSRDDMLSLQALVKEAQKNDIIESYIGGTLYDDILQMIKMRLEAEEVTCGIFDLMIERDFNHMAGEWVCRKIDFIRGMGLELEAQEYMVANLKYPQVSVKLYHELLAAGCWQDAISLLDKANAMSKGSWLDTPNWLEMKLDLLKEHGDKQSQIEVLKDLFHQRWEEKYYRQLKEMVDADEWNQFCRTLLKCKANSFDINKVAPFLIEENEFDELYQLIKGNFDSHPEDYQIVIAYAKQLHSTHEKELQGLIVRSFRTYAALHFAPGQKVNSLEYTFFCEDLSSLSNMGFGKEQRELVEIFLEEYRKRRSFVNELKSIKLNN